MFEQSSLPEARNSMADWAVRGGFALLFLSAGTEKFATSGEWVDMFRQIGFGEWFRYFTGIVEVLGAVLLLIPQTVTAGLALLGCTMGCAALFWVFRLGHPGNAIFDLGFFAALAGVWWYRRSR